MSDAEALPILDRVALRTALVRLQQEFQEIFGDKTIERFLLGSYGELTARASVTNFRALMAERFARQRLTALARVEGHDDGSEVPIVLFLCTDNAAQSQMASGWLKLLAGQGALAWSGGPEPAREINSGVIAAMAEVGIDISAEFPKPWTDEVMRAADLVVIVGCNDGCPTHLCKDYVEWNIAGPVGLSLEAVRPIRDDIGSRVSRLLNELDIP